jgi:hypothetical protein
VVGTPPSHEPTTITFPSGWTAASLAQSSLNTFWVSKPSPLNDGSRSPGAAAAGAAAISERSISTVARRVTLRR